MYIFGFILGIVLGSFVKALADRSLNKVSFWGRSYCPNCKRKLQGIDLLPILSYIFLSGKCRYCKKAIGLDYVLVEVMMGILVGFLFWQAFGNLQFTIYNLQSIFNFQFSIFISDLIFKTFFIAVLVVVFITDFKKMFIPDRIIIPSIILTIFYLIYISVVKISYLYFYLLKNPIGKYLLPPKSDYFMRHAFMVASPLLGSILMGLAIGGFFYLIIIVTRGKGMGGGDVKLGGFLGLALGFPNALIALMLSFFSGALVSIFLMLLGKKKLGQTIAFGPFLVLGSLITLFWGNQILDWYLTLKLGT